MKSFDYGDQDWVDARLGVENLTERPWQVPAIIASLIILWCLHFGLVGGHESSGGRRGAKLPPNPSTAFVVFMIGGVPFSCGSFYLWWRARQARQELPGRLLVESTKLVVVDSDGYPVMVWSIDQAGPAGSRWRGVELTPQGLRAQFEPGPGRVGPIPVPKTARGELEALLPQLRRQIEGASVRSVTRGQSEGMTVASVGGATYLGTHLSMSDSAPRLLALVGFGYLSLILCFLATILWSQDTTSLAGKLGFTLVGAGSLVGFLAATLATLRRLGTSGVAFRIEPEKVEVRRGGERREVSRADLLGLRVVPGSSSSLVIGNLHIDNLSRSQAQGLARELRNWLEQPAQSAETGPDSSRSQAALDEVADS